VVLVSTGIVLGTERLKPISWNDWAGEIEREGDRNPYRGLEERWGFWNVKVGFDLLLMPFLTCFDLD
jgi:membrane magnesium transporter 1